MRCYVPGPAGGANSAPPDLLAGFWGEKKNEKREMKGKGRERKGRRGKKGKGKGTEREKKKGEGSKGGEG